MSTTTQKETEFSNNNIKVKVTRLPGCRVEMDIAISPTASKAAYAKAIKEVSKEVSIPGFRRGKAPEGTILQKFGPQIKREWEEVLFNTALTEAMKLSNLYPAVDRDQKPFHLKTSSLKASRDDESSMKVEFEALPTVPEIEIERLTLLSVEPVSVDEKEFDKKLEELLLSKATWETLEDKKIEEGDYVDISFSYPDSEEDKENAETNRYCVRKDSISDKLYNELLGRKVDDSFLFQDEENEPVKSTVKAILKPVFPELNDDFAKKFGAADLETLKSRIALSVKAEAEARRYETISQDLMAQLTNNFPMELPESAVNKHRAAIVKRTLATMKKAMPDGSDHDYQTAVKGLEKMIDERSRHVTHLRYLVHNFSRENKIAVSDSEFEEEMKNVYYRSISGVGPYIDFSDDLTEIQTEVFNQLMTQKVMMRLIDMMEKRS